jgi:hypothetical protein
MIVIPTGIETSGGTNAAFPVEVNGILISYDG